MREPGLEERVALLEQAVANIVRHGIIEEVDLEQARARVRIGETPSGWMKWYTFRAGGGDVSWSAPKVGECVTILCENGDTDQGRILPAIYNDSNPQPAASEHIHAFKFADDGHVTYDAETHTVTIQPPNEGNIKLLVGGSEVRVKDGSVRVEADHVNVMAETVHADADTVTLEAGAVNLGGEGGEKVARVGDQVDSNTFKIIGGSDVVKAK